MENVVDLLISYLFFVRDRCNFRHEHTSGLSAWQNIVDKRQQLLIGQLTSWLNLHMRLHVHVNQSEF